MFGVMSWDWKEQPDMDEMSEMLKAVFDPENPQAPSLTEVQDGSDSYAVVVSTEPMSEREANDAYGAYWDMLDDPRYHGESVLPDSAIDEYWDAQNA